MLPFVTLAAATPLMIFQGNSILITPPKESHYPGNATFSASNFYCFAMPSGYLSFGWWLPADPSSGHDQCRPNSTTFDWYEYSTKGECTSTECRVHAVNFANSDKAKRPAMDFDYVASLINVGRGDLGNLAVSYFDEENGAYAVGTRRLLTGATQGSRENHDCHAAYRTVAELHRRHHVPLAFELVNPCTVESGQDSQQSLLEEL
ncbi:hypothetical protein D7B24_006862 [Verticillium nonalfalfae]|uniref:Uncharacterized protein n=1 Tax=Verticillium nonalfalfae TaxID=1051616 RepID=A0A3M9YAP4_9PEZI|nr:uncharacterized protein D7B24_006862 [Verticillium nonalfalfae]RNJ56846.1 hypothetical protein D7B24_006862 [Verticillium nonalfalfae]